MSAHRPLLARARLRHALRPKRLADAVRGSGGERFDSWLAHFYGPRLDALDAACARNASPASYALFRELDADVWAVLLSQQYERYPNIRALLPSMPAASLQEQWNGCSGTALMSQSKAFYVKLRSRFERTGARVLPSARVLDFGCGWGRLTRFLARDVEPGLLFGCDPVNEILDVCRAGRVPAVVARSDFQPQRLPFDEQFDLVFAFSVFTHLSEAAHERCLRAIHESLAPGGIVILTIRPPAYIEQCELMQPLRELVQHDEALLARPRYLFVSHAAVPTHPQYRGDGQIDYGETVVTMSYVRERWSAQFELLEVDLIVEDPYQVMLTLRRR